MRQPVAFYFILVVVSVKNPAPPFQKHSSSTLHRGFGHAHEKIRYPAGYDDEGEPCFSCGLVLEEGPRRSSVATMRPTNTAGGQYQPGQCDEDFGQQPPEEDQCRAEPRPANRGVHGNSSPITGKAEGKKEGETRGHGRGHVTRSGGLSPMWCRHPVHPPARNHVAGSRSHKIV